MLPTGFHKGFAAIGVIALAGCASLENAAPPVTPALLATGGGSLQTLEEGRRIFTGACVACHSAEPVGKHSSAEWRSIVAEMAPRAKLTPARQSALLAYILAAKATPPAP